MQLMEFIRTNSQYYITHAIDKASLKSINKQ